MSLTELWLKNPKQVEDKHIQQIIAFSGEGQLKDGNTTSIEFRNYLSHVPTELIQKYAEQCLNNSFPGSGYALQDVVNQIGYRLGFIVTDGRYRGSSHLIGYDGLWLSPDDQTILVEVKTTDAYRIDLNTIAGYRKALVEDKKIIEEKSSILIVVGRSDTGDLEAQIRGSMYAWNMRLISVDAILRLVKIKEEVEDPKILKRIHEILIPREFTKLDGIIDLLFSTAEDIKRVEGPEDVESDEPKKPKFTPVSFHVACVKKLEKELKLTLLRQSQASYYSGDKELGIICTISRLHKDRGPDYFWFAFHPHQKEFLEKHKRALIAFGCGSEDQILKIPFDEFKEWLNGFNITEKEDRFYWHVHISKEENKFILHRKRGFINIDLSKYII